MSMFAALDVSQEQTAVCVVDSGGALIAEGKVETCPDAIAAWLGRWTTMLRTVGMETGPLAVWLWNALAAKGLPIICLDARHASAALKMMPNWALPANAARRSNAHMPPPPAGALAPLKSAARPPPIED